MGLGLSIVKHIVGLHGGTVIAHSDGLKMGSVFTIRLPVPVTSAGLAGPARRHPTVAPIAQIALIPRLDSISVLVVDDNAETREALRSLLTSIGARVRTVQPWRGDRRSVRVVSRRAGLRPRHARPGRLRADQGDRGREKKTGASEHLPAIALTAYGRVEDRVEVFASGFDSHVIKPFDPAELAAIIKRLVETSMGQRQSVSRAGDLAWISNH